MSENLFINTPESTQEHEINPETFESTVTFKDKDGKTVKIVSYKKNGTREIQEYDPKTGKPKGTVIIHLPKTDKETSLEIEKQIQELRDKDRKVA